MGNRELKDNRSRQKLLIIVALILLLSTLVVVLTYARRRETFPLGVASSSVSRTFSISGPEDQPLDKPMGVAVSQANRLYVTDSGKDRVVVFDADGKFLLSFGQGDSEEGRLKNPTYLALDKREKVYVTDLDSKTVMVFSSEGTFLGEVWPDNDREFKWTPLALTFDREGNLYLSDILEHRIIVLKPNREIKMTIGREGREEGRLFYPNGIAVDTNGRIFVADSNNSRVQVFDAEGKFLWATDIEGLPRGVALNRRGLLYVANTLEHRLEVYSVAPGKLFLRSMIGELGSSEHGLQFPNGLAVDSDDRVYIADRGNSRVQIWSIAE